MDGPAHGRRIEILLVDDDPGDVLLTTEALEHSKLINTLHIVRDGDAALAFLRQTGPYAEVARPDLVLLDLNLPGRDGREVLAETKADDQLDRIPVVVLTTSRAGEDILRSRALGADAYCTKPVDFARLVDIVRTIDGFYLTVVCGPSTPVA
jgi:CheY-like chemotaxis protein